MQLSPERLDKHPEDASNSLSTYGVCNMQGYRPKQEDTHICIEVDQPNGKKGMLACVFDGHGGDEVSKWVEERFTKYFLATDQFKGGDFEAALKETFRLLDDEVKGVEEARIIQKCKDDEKDPLNLKERDKDNYSPGNVGCTSCVVYFNEEMIWCAVAGDSRAVLSRSKGEEVVAMSYDHKPTNPDETDRIENAGKWVDDEENGMGTNRING
jgi:serine/threonine protein phosphatase PrpC